MVIAAAILALSAGVPAQAADGEAANGGAASGGLTFMTLGKQSMLLELGAGEFALIGNEQKGRGRPTPEGNLDIVPNLDLVNFWGVFRLNPMIGGFVTTRGSLMGYAGLHGTLPLGDHIELDPFAAIGLYQADGGRDMGSTALFHAGLTGYYVFDDGFRAGVTFAHESNGTVLPREHDHCTCNPGANDLLLTVGMPTDRLGF